MINEKKIIRIPINEAIVPNEGRLTCIMDAYWVVDQNDNILLYGGSPQCNKQESIVKLILSKLYKDCKVKKLPVIFLQNYDCMD